MAGCVSLLACDACQPPNSVDGNGAVYEPSRACSLSEPVSLASSNGSGPIEATTSGNSLDLLVYGRLTGDAEDLHYLRLGTDLSIQMGPFPLRSEGTGPLYPEALAVDGNAIAAVGRQEGRRRAYFFTFRDADDISLVQVPGLSSLDRRVHVTLIEPRVGAGVQVVTHVTGYNTIGVGRLAGSMLVTRELDLPPLLAVPATTNAPQGALVVFTLEQGATSRTTLMFREVAADASPSRNTVVVEPPSDARVDSLRVVASGGNYWAFWQLWTEGQATVQGAIIDEETFAVTRLDPIVSPTEGGSILMFQAASYGEGVLVAWTERDTSTGHLYVREIRDPSAAPVDSLLRSRLSVEHREIELINVDDRPLLLWRETPLGELHGDVLTGWLECSDPQ